MIAQLLPSAGSGFLIALAAGAANFVAVLVVMRALTPGDAVGERARSHARRRRELRSALLSAKPSQRRRPIGLARRIVEALRLTRGRDVRASADKLAQAGWRSPDATTLLLVLRMASPPLLALAAYLLAPLAGPELTPIARMLIGVAGMAAGVWLPSVLLKNVIQKRYLKIQKGLPDALDLFVICAEAGLSLDAAVTRVSREIKAGAPELADELGLTAIEIGFLPDRREALLNLNRRVATPQMRGLVNTLVQTEKYGTPLAQSLRVLSAEFRDTRMMKAEEKAARLPATLTIPMISFILPPLFIVLIGPAIVQVLSASAG